MQLKHDVREPQIKRTLVKFSRVGTLAGCSASRACFYAVPIVGAEWPNQQDELAFLQLA
jgi:hypothetical protein